MNESSKYLQYILLIFLLIITSTNLEAQKKAPQATIINVDSGWAANSVNTVIFRKNSLVTYKDTQFISFYDQSQHVVLGKRKIGHSNWELRRTAYKGQVSDAHNDISIMMDGAGYLHIAWDHHNTRLRYARSLRPGSLELTGELHMTEKEEQYVSYPEFYRLSDGNLLFLYRNGGSGKGNLVINKYNCATQQWTQLHRNLVDGEGRRSAYWQASVDSKGTIHLSWVWRESPDVASNHDLCYARSTDGGLSWERSTGEEYKAPITAATAEYALQIPQKSELINQTSMSTSEDGAPFIATYWRESGSVVPQYQLVYLQDGKWEKYSFNFRQTNFTLSGGGTKRIPVSRPQVLVKGRGHKASVFLIFRDEERGNKVSVAVLKELKNKECKVIDLAAFSVGSWEPTFDTELWKEKGQLHLFVQRVEQVDAEGSSGFPPQVVQVWEWTPNYKKRN